MSGPVVVGVGFAVVVAAHLAADLTSVDKPLTPPKYLPSSGGPL
jgi:hypothetical protein